MASPARGVHVKVIAGTVGPATGPVVQPATDPTYLDIELDAEANFVQALPPEHSAFVYVFEGELSVVCGDTMTALPQHTLAVLGSRGPGPTTVRICCGACDSGRRSPPARAGGALRAVRHEHPGSAAPGV